MCVCVRVGVYAGVREENTLTHTSPRRSKSEREEGVDAESREWEAERKRGGGREKERGGGRQRK